MSEDFDTEYVERLLDEYKSTKEALGGLEKRADMLKQELASAVDTYGIADASGHVWLQVGDAQLKRERRVSRFLDMDMAKEWAITNGLWDDLKEVIEVFSEDKMLAYAWENPDVAETIATFYKEREVWAFKA